MRSRAGHIQVVARQLIPLVYRMDVVSMADEALLDPIDAD
jgi:hypothetical protein